MLISVPISWMINFWKYKWYLQGCHGQSGLTERRFQLSVESNRLLLWFCQTSLCDWSKKKTCATFSTIRFKTPSNLDLGTRFPALHAVLLFLIRVLIGSWWCQFSLRLALVITVFFEIEMKTVLIYENDWSVFTIKFYHDLFCHCLFF